MTTGNKPTQRGSVMPLILCLGAFGIFTTLLCNRFIGEAAYCFLAAATAILGLVLHGFGRLQDSTSRTCGSS